MSNKLIINAISLCVGAIIGYFIVVILIEPKIELKKPAPKIEYKPAYRIYVWDKTDAVNRLYCDSFQFKNPYWLEYWYKGRKIQLASIKPIGVDSRED